MNNGLLGTISTLPSSLIILEPSIAFTIHKPVKQRGTQFVETFSWASAIGLTANIASAMAVVVGGLFLQALAPAQPVQAQTIFENVTIGPKFSPDPMIIKGISGGSIPVSDVAKLKETPTGPCVGFVDEQPDHTIELTAFFKYLSLVVESPQDTTIVISGPGGTWCNDDFQGKNPGIAGQWLAGTYRVWVGSYDKNKYHPYVIKISEVQLVNPGSLRR